jgi:hypothetical protein
MAKASESHMKVLPDLLKENSVKWQNLFEIDTFLLDQLMKETTKQLPFRLCTRLHKTGCDLMIYKSCDRMKPRNNRIVNILRNLEFVDQPLRVRHLAPRLRSSLAALPSLA